MSSLNQIILGNNNTSFLIDHQEHQFIIKCQSRLPNKTIPLQKNETTCWNWRFDDVEMKSGLILIDLEGRE